MSLAERTGALTAPIRAYFEGLNDRERKLMALLGLVGVLIFVVLPMYMVLDSITEREAENREIMALLRDLDQQGDDLLRRKAERDAVWNLFRQSAPALGGFLETQARSRSLSLREVTDQPDQDVGGFTRRRVNAQIPNADIEPMMTMLETIENSEFPVSISRIEADRAGQGKYNFRVGVDAYARGSDDAEEAPRAGAGGDR